MCFESKDYAKILEARSDSLRKTRRRIGATSMRMSSRVWIRSMRARSVRDFTKHWNGPIPKAQWKDIALADGDVSARPAYAQGRCAAANHVNAQALLEEARAAEDGVAMVTPTPRRGNDRKRKDAKAKVQKHKHS